MYKLTLALSLLSSAVAAEYTTTLLLIGFDSQSAVGSVIATDATATTYSLTCAASVNSADCGIPPSFTITQGPSTMHYAFPANERGNPAEVAGCDITTDHGVCSGSIVASGSSTSTEMSDSNSGTDTMSYSNYGTDRRSYSNYGKNIGAQVVTITAGAAPGATGSSSSIASTPATTTTSAQGGQTVGSSGSSGSSKVSTGGVPMITGHAQWAIGGAAAAVAIAAM